MKNCFWVLFSLHILLISCSGSCKSKKDINFIKKNAISDVNTGCTEDEITDRNSVTIAYRDSLLSRYDGLKYFSYTKSVGDDSYSMEIETFPDTISVSEENGIRYTVIKRNGLVLDVRQKGDLFSNGRIYCKHSEYNDSCLSTKVTWFLDDTIKLLSYEETAAFIKDSIYDINYDGVNDLVLTYSVGSSTNSDIYLFGHNGMVLREKVLRNYFPLLDGEFIQSDSYRSGIVFFQKLKWNELQIDTLEQIYYDVADKRSYIVPPLEIDENGTYVKNKEAMPINKMLDKCYLNALSKY